jgi:hypothetical protein
MHEAAYSEAVAKMQWNNKHRGLSKIRAAFFGSPALATANLLFPLAIEGADAHTPACRAASPIYSMKSGQSPSPTTLSLSEAAMPVLGERRVVRHLAIEAESTKPAIGEVQVHLLAQPPFGGRYRAEGIETSLRRTTKRRGVARCQLFSAADDFCAREQRMAHRKGGNLRAGTGRNSVGRRKRSDQDGQRYALWTRCIRVDTPHR